MSDLWGPLQRANTGQLKSWTHMKWTAMRAAIPPTYQQVCVWSIQWKQTETMGVMWVRGTGSTTLCNWFSKPESSEVAAHMGLNCGVQPYRHSHNPLPMLQQTPWQTGGTEADTPLSKQVHIAVIAHCSPVHGSDWFCSQVSQWTEPRASAS